jgi:hypothetical protein
MHDKNGVPILPDLIEFDLHRAFSQMEDDGNPITVEIDLDFMFSEAEAEMARIINEPCKDKKH